MNLYRDHHQNYKVYGIPKAQLIIADIPYNLGNKAYASNPAWYNNGDNTNGEIDNSTVISESKKIKSELKLDTGAKINLDIQVPGCSTENLERGYDEEKKMFFYKVYFNSEQ